MVRKYPPQKYLANRGGVAYRCGVSLQDGVHLAQGEQVFLGEEAGLTPGCIQDGAGMTLCNHI